MSEPNWRDHPRYYLGWKVLLAFPIAAVITLLWVGYLRWSEPTVPVFPDVVNADGTIDYVLTSVERGRRRGRGTVILGYSTTTLRLPKDIKVVRPFAGGAEMNGGGVSMRIAANPNGDMYFHLNIAELVNNGRASPDIFDLKTLSGPGAIRVGILAMKQTGTHDPRKDKLMSSCILLSSKTQGVVEYIDNTNAQIKCPTFSSAYDHYVVLEAAEVKAFVRCLKGLIGICVFEPDHLRLPIYVEIARSNLSDLPAINTALQKFLRSATINQSTVNFEKVGK